MEESMEESTHAATTKELQPPNSEKALFLVMRWLHLCGGGGLKERRRGE